MKAFPAAHDLRVSPLARNQAPALREALRAANLPADDLDAEDTTLFSFDDQDGPAGYGGLEVYGRHALLRSIFVSPDRRRRGVGRRIVDMLLSEAASMGVARAYLLTTDARAYFERLGFAVIDRRDAPSAILCTRQATGLCPASAALLMKVLTP